MATKPKTTPAAEPKPELRILTLEEILAADDLGTETLAMPEWGANAAVRIRGLSMDDVWAARRVVKGIADDEERINATNMEFIRIGVIEPKLTSDMLTALRAKSSDAIMRLYKRIGILSAATAEVQAKLEAEFPAEQPG